MERYKYRAINQNGRPQRGVISATGEADLYKQLQSAGLELIDCSKLGDKKGLSLGGISFKKVKLREVIQFFIQMEQMQGAGVSMLDSLADIRDTADNPAFKDIMTEVQRDVSDGSSLSEAMAKHPKVFKSLYLSLIKAGEDTGDLTSSYSQLVKYLKWVDDMQTKIRKATRYPMIVMVVVLGTVVIMMGHVVPQIVGFIANLDQELPFYTVALIKTSEFFQAYWWAIIGVPIFLFIFVKVMSKLSDGFAYNVDKLLLVSPLSGDIIRKIAIARYAQTFGALFASGIDVISALRSARETVSNKVILEALEEVEQAVKTGSPISEAFNNSGEFPSLVVRMLKIGEESGNLTHVLDQVAEFYTKDVDEAIDGLIAMIEPGLTGILGIMILWIAAGVFGPIYSSFENIDF